MITLTVRLFGRFGIRSERHSSVGPGARRAREVLSYLLLYPDRAHRREKLADLLWEDTPPEQARKCLRQALWQIQAALQREDDGSGRFPLEVDPEWIQLHSCNALQVDVHRFESAIHCCHGIAGPQLDDYQRHSLEDAVQLYRGDLLEGWEQGWCLAERERLQNELLDALDKLVTGCEARHDSERGLGYARRMLAADPAREQAHCHLMRLHLLSGNRTEALRAYQCCERLLMQELGVRPSEATRALHESIREGRSDSPWSELALLDGAMASPMGLLGADWGGEASGRLPALADHLARVQSTLARIEARLRQEMSRGDEAGGLG
jgi:DNA-binding SARP family transcriptional activator